MSLLLQKTAEPRIQSQTGPGFHLLMAYAYSTLVLVTVVACRLASVYVPHFADLAIGLFFIFAIVFTLAVYWHEKGAMNLRDAALTLPWAILLVVTLPPLVIAIAKLDLPLQDAHLARVDQLLGINLPHITSWSANHRVGRLVNRTYPLLSPLLTLSVLLPALTGKAKHAQQFVMGNLAAFFIGLPLFALIPAVGPWYGYGFTPTPHQIECQTALLLFRGAGHPASQLDAIVCFPSFHVIWAIFCVVALWGFRLLRIPASLLAGMIIISTVTTGWHYFIDVLGGIIIAGLSLAIARACIDASKDCSQQLESYDAYND
jgi:PAP2 superfamily